MNENIDLRAELVERLSDGHEGASALLNEVTVIGQDPQIRTPLIPLITLLDLDDMQMRGEQIITAYVGYCDSDTYDFIAACATRDAAMVEYVNNDWLDTGGDPEKLCRQHGPQKTIPAVNTAVKQVLDDAAKSAVLEQLDEGAEYVNLFFISLLKHMQRSGEFHGKMSVNLGTGDGTHAVFMIYLVELQDSEGKPLNARDMSNDYDGADET